MTHGRATLWILATLTILIGGCSSTGRSNKAKEMYDQGQYAAALAEASAIARNTSGPEHERASLIAGMSAASLKKYSEAEQWLRPIAYSTDRSISGRALATLGLTQVAQDRFSPAAIDLSNAARRLDGDESARSHFFAGECYLLMGRLDAATKSYNLALATAKDPTLRSKITARMNTSAYTLQLGAFSNRANADRNAANASMRAQRAGLGTPTIVSTPDISGRMIHLVQLGRFKSKQEAQTARIKLGGDAVVVPVR